MTAPPEVGSEFPHLDELQRPKLLADGQLIARTFRPYVEAATAR